MSETENSADAHNPLDEREIVMLLELSEREMTWDEMGKLIKRDPRDLITFATLALPDLAAKISARSIAQR